MKQKDILILSNSGTSGSPIWASTAKTLTDFSESKNANTEESQYVENATAETIVLNYAPTIAFTSRPQATTAEPSALDTVIWNAALNDTVDATVEILFVYLLKEGPTPTSFVAKRVLYSIQLDGGPSGAAGATVEISGTLNQKGDATTGSAELVSGSWEFTAA